METNIDLNVRNTILDRKSQNFKGKSSFESEKVRKNRHKF